MNAFRFAVLIAVAIIELSLAASAGAAEAIRVGFLGPLTGIFAQAGKDMVDGVKLGLEQGHFEAGGRTIEIYEAKDADAVCAVFVAGQAVRFVKQYGEFGLKGKLPLIGTGVMIDESALRGMGDEADGALGATCGAEGGQLAPASRRPALRMRSASYGGSSSRMTRSMPRRVSDARA